MIAYVFPGQGSQSVGMGQEYFDEFKDLIQIADEVLGYSIKKLCLEDPEGKLNFTQYTQPALYVVNALAYLKKIQETGVRPDVVAGHSLGEYNALFAAGVYDFATGLKLVKKRGELMGQAKNGGMAAVLGMDETAVRAVIEEKNLTTIDIANLNSPAQTVIAGKKEDIEAAVKVFEEAGARRVVVLNVSGAFHSRYMGEAQTEFMAYMNQFEFKEPEITCFSNVYGRPYNKEIIKETLTKQITSSVRWTDIIRYIWGMDENCEIIQVGPGRVLTDLTTKIKRTSTPFNIEELKRKEQKQVKVTITEQHRDDVVSVLGSDEFKHDYGLQYAYAVGPMESGITTKEMVARCAKAGLLGIYASNNLSSKRIEEDVNDLTQQLGSIPFGVALSPDYIDLKREETIVSILCKYDVKMVQASYYINVSKQLVKYKAKGLTVDDQGKINHGHKIMAKLSRPEVVEEFLKPAADSMIEELLQEGEITNEQAQLLKKVPMVDSICVESNSAGRTDSASMLATFPAIARMVERLSNQYHYDKKVSVGCSGSIGSPEAIVALFALGADFVMTGSINQCTVESGTSNLVKKILQEMDIQGTEYIPSGDDFDYNSKMQVVKRGVLFPVRANKLSEVYKLYGSIAAIDSDVKKKIEEHYFKHTMEEVFDMIRPSLNQTQINRLERSPKYKMALIFQWYYKKGFEDAIQGKEDNVVNLLIYSSVAMGAFNAYVKNTELEQWGNRHVDEIGVKLMRDAEVLFKDKKLN